MHPGVASSIALLTALLGSSCSGGGESDLFQGAGRSAAAQGGSSFSAGNSSATGGLVWIGSGGTFSGPSGGNRASGGTSSTNRSGGTGSGARASGGTKATGGTAAASGGTASTATNTPMTGGSTGYMTRYWDCCKPSCAWSTAVPACQVDGTTKISDRNARSGCDSGGTAFECYDFAPWYDSGTNTSYAFVAYNAAACGACYKLQFTGESQNGATAGATAIKGKQMIVQAINIGDIQAGQFDLLVPGGGVGAMQAGCTAQWGSGLQLGATYGGFALTCNNDPTCIRNMCQAAFGSKAALMAGCEWYIGWYSAADNPKVLYQQVSCPSQLTSKSGISG